MTSEAAETSDAAPVLEATDVRKTFGRTVALDGVSLEAQSGEVTCIIGHNGAGKTTFLNLLSGVNFADSGDIRVLGLHRWKQNYEIRKRSFTLPNSPSYFDASSAYEHLALIAQVYGIPEEQLSAEIELDVGKLKSWVGLSTGTGRKVGLIAAFLPDVKLRIFDEPFAGNIDPAGVETLYRWFAQARSRGETIIFSTQILDQAEEIADQILLLRKGVVRACGSPAELLQEAGISPSEPRALSKAYFKLNEDEPGA